MIKSGGVGIDHSHRTVAFEPLIDGKYIVVGQGFGEDFYCIPQAICTSEVIGRCNGVEESHAEIVIRCSREFCGIEHARETLCGIAQIPEVCIGEVFRISPNTSAVKEIGLIKQIHAFREELAVLVELLLEGFKIHELLIEGDL